jgi:hypothetical protein
MIMTTIVEPAARAMARPERAAYLREHGWRHRIECGGAQSWEPPGTAPHEASFTLAGAIREQLLREHQAGLPHIRGIPVVPSKRAEAWPDARGDLIWHWVIDCPYCGKEHTHSPSPGHRVSHCQHPRSGPGYYIEHPAGDDAW